MDHEASFEPEARAFVDLVAPALRQASSIARALEGRVSNTPKDAESTAVKQALTVADTASQEAILVPIYERYPELRLEAEEDTATAALFRGNAESLVVVDPIDGTLHHFLEHKGPYAVMVGLARRGRYEAALIALPREGIFFEATLGNGAFKARAGRLTKSCSASADGNAVLVSTNMPADVLEALRGEGLDPRPGCGGAIAVAPLLRGFCGGLRWAPALAEGVSTRGRVGLLIAREAGAIVRGVNQEEFPADLRTPGPVLAVAADEDSSKRLGAAVQMLGERLPPGRPAAKQVER